MAKVQPGRYTTELDGEVAVFLIGMRINRPWKVSKWWPVFVAMPRMLRRLQAQPDLGLLHVQQGMLSGHPLVLCYFRSIEHLSRSAKDPSLSSPGARSTARSPAPATSASGTRRTACRPTGSSASTATCRPGVSAPRSAPSRPDARATRRRGAWVSQRPTSPRSRPISVASPVAKARGDKTVITNRRARHEYSILDVFEAGLVLKGSEVKSIREGRANLQDAFARVTAGEVWLFGMHVSPYAYAHIDVPDPVRARKLLLHHKEIVELERATAEKGVTIVPLRVYFRDGRAKVEIAVARGKAHHDKRQALAERDAKREAERAMKGLHD